VVPNLSGVIKHTSLAGITSYGSDGFFQAFICELSALNQFIQVGYVAGVVFAMVKFKGAP
jgi:hypothetical protein